MPNLSKIFLCILFFFNVCYAGLAPLQQGNGENPALSKYQDVLVEVYQSKENKILYYRVGLIKDYAIQWGESYSFSSGIKPSIALHGNTVVVTHQIENQDDLWYHVGTVDTNNKTILWGDAHLYDNGLNSKVALNGEFVIEAHQYNEFEKYPYYMQDEPHTELITHSHCHYKTGKINSTTKTIDWLYGDKYGIGENPAIAIKKNKIIELHQINETIWSKIGTLQSNGAIRWGLSTRVDYGVTPSLAIEGNLVLEMHKSQNFENLWYRLGLFNAQENTMNWFSSHFYTSGKNPSIALNAGLFIEVHQGVFNDVLYQNRGFIHDNFYDILWYKMLNE